MANNSKLEGKKGEQPQECQTYGKRSRRNGAAAGGKICCCRAADYGLSVRTVSKWKHRYAVGGVEALSDTSSRPKRCRCSLTKEDMARIRELRIGRKTGDEIALLLGLCRSTVFRALRKLGLSRLASLEPKPAVRRYEWDNPGDMLNVDIKRLGKIDGMGHRKAGIRQVQRQKSGWEYLHVCVDGASRLAYTAIHADETSESAVEFLWCAVALYKQHGIKVKRVLTDNGACYKSWKFRLACSELGIQHKTRFLVVISPMYYILIYVFHIAIKIYLNLYSLCCLIYKIF